MMLERLGNSIGKELGITEIQAMTLLESPGAHQIEGFLSNETGRIYYDVFTERSDVSVTTAAVGATPQTTLRSPREVSGYRVFIGPTHRGIFLAIQERTVASELHHLAITEARLGGNSHALSAVMQAAQRKGIEARYCGIATH
jgi:hypothetical protein